MSAPDEPRWTLMLVPGGGEGEVRQLEIGRREVRRAALGAAAIAGLALLGAFWGALTTPRAAAYGDLLEENLALKSRLQDIELQLDEVEITLQRIQLYDSQLREAWEGSGLGGRGPADGLPLEPAPEPWEGADGAPMDDLGDELDEEPLLPEDLRPAEAWAVAVEARVAQALSQLSDVEPGLNQRAVDAADLLSVRSSFPQRWPLDGVLTSGFGYRRSPTGNKRWKFHSGIDISAPRGARIYAAAPGTVKLARYNGGYGRTVVLDHGYGVETLYAHNTSLFVREGDYVKAGQAIATVGSTGQSTGPHLHFELSVNGHKVDPLDHLPR